MKLLIHIDGGSRGNPGPAAAGVVIRTEDPPKVIHEAGYFLGRATNNVAEYQGLLRGLELATSLGADEVAIVSDSELMVRQITGEYRVKSRDLLPLYEKAQSLLLKIDTWTMRHVLRGENQRADELANMSLDQGRDVILAPGRGTTGGGKAAGAVEAAAPAGKRSAITAPARGKTRASAPEAVAGGEAPRAWDARLEEEPGDRCPARCPAKRPFRFGPTTPEGFCVFAAQAVLDELPLRNPDAEASAAECARCGVRIGLEPAG